jgi:hypothetical protein
MSQTHVITNYWQQIHSWANQETPCLLQTLRFTGLCVYNSQPLVPIPRHKMSPHHHIVAIKTHFNTPHTPSSKYHAQSLPKSEDVYNISKHDFCYSEEELHVPMPNPQSGQLPFVARPWSLTQCICSYPPYLETISSICSLTMCHAMVITDPINMDCGVLCSLSLLQKPQISHLTVIQNLNLKMTIPHLLLWLTYPAAMASKLAGTAAVSRRRGSSELLASPSNATRSSLSRFT